jgi:PD-(D/E)XK endonuclease
MDTAKGASRGRISPRWRSSVREAAQTSRLDALDRGDLGEVAFVLKAMSLGFVVAKPYGHNHPYDFLVQGGSNLWRVQVKTCGYVRNGWYTAAVCHSRNGSRTPYTEAELDFLVVYLMPEEAWYILPVRDIAARYSLPFRVATASHPRDPHAHYREAWHQLREPDGLTFG